MRSFIKKYSLIFFFVLLFGYIFITKLDVKKIIDVFNSISIANISVLILLYFILSCILIVCKYYLFYSFGHKLRIKNIILIHFASLTANYSTPAKIGYPLSLFLYKKLEQVSYITSSLIIIIELSVSMSICGLIAVFGSADLIKVNKFRIINILFISFIILSVIVIVIYIYRKKIKKSKFFKFINDILKAFKTIKLQNFFTYFLLMIVNRLAGSFLFFLIVLCVGGEVTYLQAIIVSSASFFLGAISMIPIGLGVKEGTSLFFLNLYGVPNEICIAVLVLDRTISTVLSYILGIISGGILGVKNIIKDEYSKNLITNHITNIKNHSD